MIANKAIFLDRDGVINNNSNHYYVYDKSQFAFNPNVTEALQNYVRSGYMLIIVSNQGGIAKGLYSKKQVNALHAHMLKQLAKKNIVIDAIYYCPHHSDLENCLCRKPGSLLIEKALACFNLDRESCYFIGDSERDIEAAVNAKVKGIKIASNAPLPLLPFGSDLKIKTTETINSEKK